MEEVWKDFDENGVDLGPYEEGDDDRPRKETRRKSKTSISDAVSVCRNVLYKIFT